MVSREGMRQPALLCAPNDRPTDSRSDVDCHRLKENERSERASSVPEQRTRWFSRSFREGRRRTTSGRAGFHGEDDGGMDARMDR